jgi:hypothetical protein
MYISTGKDAEIALGLLADQHGTLCSLYLLHGRCNLRREAY